MKSHVYVGSIFILMATIFSGALAEWSPSVQVSELNTIYNDATPCLLSDGLTIYFTYSNRPSPSFYWHRIYTATRNSTSDPFSNITEVSTLNQDAHVLFPWVSADNKRMYYQSTQTGGPKLYYTERNSTSDSWMPGTGIAAFNAFGGASSVSLSSDECTALFTINNGSSWNTYIATRANKYSLFSSENISAVTSMNNPGSADPYLMPDALSAYYVWGHQLYKTSRATINDEFGAAELIAGFDGIRSPSFSADGKTLYWTKAAFDQYGKPIGDLYVSHFIPEPATMLLLGAGMLLIRRKMA